MSGSGPERASCHRVEFLAVRCRLGSFSPLGVGLGCGRTLESSLTRVQGERKRRPGEGLTRGEEKLLPRWGFSVEVHDGVPTAHSPMSLGAVCPMLSGALGLSYVAINTADPIGTLKRIRGTVES